MAPPSKKQKRSPLPTSRMTRASLASVVAAASAAHAAAVAAAYASATPTTTTTTPMPAAAASPAPALPAPAPAPGPGPGPALAAAAADDDDDGDEYHPAQALPATSAKPSGAITALSKMPAARGADARTTKALDLQRSSNREAYLAQCVGAVQTVPCKSCLKDQGPWKGCVLVSGFLVGSCANCHYGGEGGRCSFRPCKFNHFPLPFLLFG